MDTELKNRIQTKIFIGCQITPDLYRQLSSSAEYKLAKISGEVDRLVEIDYKQKKYIGRYCERAPCSLPTLKSVEADVALKLLRFCPSFNKDIHHLLVFSQIFIT